MLSHVARFELRYQLSSAIFWITFIVFFLLTWSLITSDTLRIGWGGYVSRNSPYTTALLCMIMGVFAVFIATSFASNVVLRDDDSGFGPIMHTTRISKFDYLFGRFIGGFLVSCLAFLAVPLSLLLGAAMPWLDPSTVSAFRLDTYLYAYFAMSVPTLFVLCAIFFALATITRSMLTTYVVALVFLMAYFLTASYLARPEFKELMSWLDPFALAPLRFATEVWTPSERNTLLPPFLGPLLQNRLLWTAIGLVSLAMAWRVYRPQKPSDTKTSKAAKAAATEQEKPAVALATAALPRPSADARSLGWGPLATLAKFDALSVIRSPGFIVLVGIALINAIVGLWIAGDDTVSITRPVTRIMINMLNEQFSMIPLIIAAYYAGELVWRDRERRVHEIVDATPAADWAFLVPKIFAIAIVLFVMAGLSVVSALIVQTVKGYSNYEVSHYLWWYLAPWLLSMLAYAVLAVFIQTLVSNKYAGLLVVMLILAAQMSFPGFGLENHLYLYSDTSPVPLSDMNGQGKYAGYAAWYRLYWAGAMLVLAVLAYALWRRGASAPLKVRLQRLPARLKGTAGFAIATGVAIMVGAGGFIVYNTKVLNEWRSLEDSQRWAADYEKQVLPLQSVVQPRITDVKLDIQLYPDEPRAVTRGSYIVENKSDQPLNEVHVSWPRQLEMKSFLGTLVLAELQLPLLEVQGATLEREIPDMNYRIFKFDQPLQPGQRAEIQFETVRNQKGFRNSANETRVVENGTFLDNFQILPILGPNHFLALGDRGVRRKFGLTDERRPPPLEDESGRANHYFRHDSDWVNAKITITSDEDQVVLAPGYKVDERVENGRRTARFETEAPIHNFFSIQSARYAVAEDKWNDVELAVYYHPEHEYNVKTMLEASKASIKYFSENFSPFQFRQMRIVEFPAYMNFAQAFPGTVPYSEAAGFIIDIENRGDRIDGVTYVTAHEIGHQWWGHQVIGADMQGQTVLSETLAQYAALMVMEKTYGLTEVRRFLKSSLGGYLRNRATDVLGEVSLERVEEQAHVRYQKGGLVMYLLKDQMGEEAVNRALRSLIKEYAFKGPPYPTSRDLIVRLRAEAGPQFQDLITDLFENITLYELEVTGGRSTQRDDGKWSVEIDVEASKQYADALGVEHEAPLEAVMDIGVFSADPANTTTFTEEKVLSLQHQPIKSGKQTFTVVVDQEPKFVGLDPYNKYIDRLPENNVLDLSKQ
jgi:ABC-2 type transport system permease protein